MVKAIAKDAVTTTAGNDTLLNQSINISNYMYYGQYVSYGSTGLKADIGLTPLVIDGQTLKKTIASQGLFEEAFITTGPGPKQVIIGYEGTDVFDQNNPNTKAFTGGQIVADSQILAGQTPQSFQSAAKFASNVISTLQANGIKASVSVTGHSLGAAEAEYAAAKLGLGGDTFGTPGIVAPKPSPTLSAKQIRASQQNLQNYVDIGDPVGNYATDGSDPYGSLMLSQTIKHYGTTTSVGQSGNDDSLDFGIFNLKEYVAGNGIAFAATGLSSLAYAAGYYHILSNYASDLKGDGVVLEPIDGSGSATAGTDAGLFAPLVGAAAAAQLSQVMCFCSGTRIATATGEQPVERLAVGDLVETIDGSHRPVTWIGHRTIDCTSHAAPHDVHPVRIAAGAFGSDVPTRDLVLSPGHPVLVGGDGNGHGGHLVPIICLINGTTIARVPVDRVTYWHIELEAHDILLAEGLPAESYLDCGDRTFFTQESHCRLADPDNVIPAIAGRCRPVAIDGALVEIERRRLDAVFAADLSAACAWPALEDMSPT